MFIYTSLLLTILIVVVNGIYPTAKDFDENVTDLMKLHRSYILEKEALNIIEVFEVQCRLIGECCPKQEENLFTLISEELIDKQCLDNKTKQSSSCQTMVDKLNSIKKDSTYHLSYQISPSGSNVDPRREVFTNWTKRLGQSCSKDELRAYYCDRWNFDQTKSCYLKALKKINQEHNDNGIFYGKYYVDLENAYLALTQFIAYG